MEQGSPEWLAIRCGSVTASRVADVCAKLKNGEAATRRNYRAQLVAERLTGQPAESFSNAAMQRGTDLEPIARGAYESRVGVFVDQVGYVQHPWIAFSGASPDGLIAPQGLVEIKCPNTANHIDTLLSNEAPAQYITQMQWQMACTGALWCDFVSFDPRMPEDLQLFVKRVHRDNDLIAEYEKEVVKFLAEVDETLAKLQALREAVK